MPTETAAIGISAISPTDAGHVLWFFAHGAAAIRPGTFTEHVMATIAHADSVNRLALTVAFPGLAAAIAVPTQETGGLAALTEIAAAGARDRGHDHSTNHACDPFDSAGVTGEVC